LRGLSSQPGFRGRGLLGRFLYLLPPSLLGYRTLRADREGASIPDGVLADYEAGLRAMLNWKPDRDPSGGDRPHLLTMEKAAYEEWLNFALRVEDGMKPGGAYEGITDLAGKVPGGAARIAAVLHGIQHAHASPWEAKIEQATMEQALDIAAVCLTHGLAAMDLMGADPTIAAARTVWTWIERGRHRQSAVRDVFNALRGTFPRVSSLNVALEALEERGYIRVTPVPKAGGTAGRPKSPSIVVRPDFVETWK
jgi:hypothetical protein